MKKNKKAKASKSAKRSSKAQSKNIEKNRNAETFLLPSASQKKFLSPLIAEFNEKFNVLLAATSEVMKISKTIREFSTHIVAEGRRGEWFAVRDDLVVRKDHPEALKLPVLAWSVEAKDAGPKG